MDLGIIKETVELMAREKYPLTEEEKQLVVRYAFKTGDRELTEGLIRELIRPEGDKDAVMHRYNTMLEKRENWIDRIENLLVAVEIYRLKEEKALRQLADVLGAYGIDVSVDELQTKDTRTIQEMVKVRTRS